MSSWIAAPLPQGPAATGDLTLRCTPTLGANSMPWCAPCAGAQTAQLRPWEWGGQEQSCELLLSHVPHASIPSSLRCLTEGPHFTDEETGAQRG